MNRLMNAPGRLARRLLPRHRGAVAPANRQTAFAVPAGAITALSGPDEFRRTLLQLVGEARQRIVIVALYLQDDDSGREVLDALYAAKARHPALRVTVYVDWHRARRGLIGRQHSEGNAAMYREFARRLGDGVEIRGVPVQGRELLGVLHLKGWVIDDTVLYTGASLNDVYLARHGRYRLDRYHLLRHRGLADALAGFVERHFADNAAVPRLDTPGAPATRALLPAIRELRQALQSAAYAVPHETPQAGEVAVTPLLGLGRNDNALNDALLALLQQARERVILLTPYFNLPRSVRVAVGMALRRGCRIDIMVGDKTANDFYIPPEQPFTTIGLLPYLYENNLRRFARAHARQLASGQLNLWLWRDGDNSYHLKGLLVDDDAALLTGHNLNPRAWALDLENGLLLRDPAHCLHAMHEAEWAALRRHATRLADYHALESPRRYPAEVRRLLRRLSRVRLDRLVNRLL
ncbi:CDP-diacylglycerol--serine O-phosphatidyltransferase [Rhodanobacter aciditrophus]|uniref:CDP-diacylglycerol--serine O-phosphatidyltransferase n=1 Tax=Rhodanobacter aciditrophus TaxID=1623218 RepID=UPI003CEEC059